MSKLPKPVNATERYLYDLTEKMDCLIRLLSDKRDKKDDGIEMTDEEFYAHIEEEERRETLNYEDMTKNELVKLLADRDVDFNKRDLKDKLIALAKETE